MSTDPLDSFREQVALKYQLYNGLFLTLPFEPLGEVGIQLPVFADLCRRRLGEGANPLDIVEEFFSDTLGIEEMEQRLPILFLFLQLVERQVVLFDALEDAAYAELHPSDGADSLTALRQRVRVQGCEREAEAALHDYRTRIVLTAHPTQFYPEPVLNIIQDLARALHDNDLRAIEKLLLQMGKTSFRNPKPPTPLGEANSLLRSHARTLYTVMTDIQVRLGYEAATVLELGFWPGGDRDGNPYVTAETTLEVAARLHEVVRDLHLEQLGQLRRRLTFKGLLEALNDWEQLLRSDDALSLPGLLADLERLRVRLLDEHQGLFVDELDRLICSLRIFGFHFASLDIRQDSSVHSELMGQLLPEDYLAMDEEQRMQLLVSKMDEASPSIEDDSDTLASLVAAKSIQEQNGVQACHRYIISNTGAASNVLEVLLFMHWCDCSKMDVVPLFETIEDLRESEAIMRRLFACPVYRQHLERRGQRQVVMLGFSDGTKDGGFLSCNWEILLCKERLEALAVEHGVKIVFFDGRGGPPARGGGNAHHFYRVLGYHVPQREIQLTVQGQTISSKYGTLASAQHNLETLMTAGLEHKLFPRPNEAFAEDECQLMQRLSDYSYEAYCELKEHPEFLYYLEHRTPLKNYGDLNIASRPPKRGRESELSLSDLRAIPFVGAWSLMKQNVPGYYGLGRAIERVINEGHEVALRALYHKSLFVRTLIATASQALAKSYIPLTQYLKDDPKVSKLWNLIEEETVRTRKIILDLTGASELLADEPLVQASIAVREQLILPLLVIQQYALQRHLKDDKDVAHEKLLLKSIPAIVNASRNSA